MIDGFVTLAIDLSFVRTIITRAAAVHGTEVSAEEPDSHALRLFTYIWRERAESLTDGPHKMNLTN